MTGAEKRVRAVGWLRDDLIAWMEARKK